MQRRSFLKAGGAITLAAGLGANSLLAHVPTHNFQIRALDATGRSSQNHPTYDSYVLTLSLGNTGLVFDITNHPQ